MRKTVTIRALSLFLAIMFLISNCNFALNSHAASYSYGTVNTGGIKLNVRTGPSTSKSIVTRLSNKSLVKIKDSSGSWYKIEYASGKTGYVYAQYIKLSDNSTSSTVSGSSYPVTAKVTNGGVPLKLRKGASTATSILANIPRGSNIVVTSKYNSSWYKASYAGKSGYVSSSYVVMPSSTSSNKVNTSTVVSSNKVTVSSISKPTSTSTTVTSKYKYTKVNLNVPDYRQTDPRWKYVKVPNTGSTILYIGCTATGIAEIESFMNKTSITPPQMIKKLKFSKDGYLYWPSGYSQCWNYNLNSIYNLLKRGKPVLLGCKSSSGRQHWVVVTGYNNNTNGSLKASDFKINDPMGRHSNLGEYMKMFPRFYKYVYR